MSEMRVAEVELRGEQMKLREPLPLNSLKFVEDALADFLESYQKLDKFIDAKKFLQVHFKMAPDKTNELKDRFVKQRNGAKPIQVTVPKVEETAKHFAGKKVKMEEVWDWVLSTYGQPDTEKGKHNAKLAAKKIVESLIGENRVKKEGVARGTTYKFEKAVKK